MALLGTLCAPSKCCEFGPSLQWTENALPAWDRSNSLFENKSNMGFGGGLRAGGL
jgi:hypothetical protein